MRNPKSFRFTSWLSEFTFFRLAPQALRLTVFFLSLSPLLLVSPSVVHAQWEPDVRLTYNDSASWTSHNNAWCLASGPGGSVHVVWRDTRDGHWVVYYKRSTDYGTNWSQDRPLSNNPQQRHAGNPSIATTDSLVHVVWEDDRDPSPGGGPEIYYKRSTDYGMNWTPDFRISYDYYLSLSPSIAAVDLVVHIVWVDSRDGNYEIYYKGSTDGGLSWTPETRLTNDPNTSNEPSIAISDSVVHLVWDEDRHGPPGNIEIYYKRSSDMGSTWSPETRLTFDPHFSWQPTIAVTGPNVHVVWKDTRDGNTGLYYKHSTDWGITWDTMDVPLTNVRSILWDPNVAASGSNIHVVWDDNRDGGNNVEIYYKRSTDSGLTWSQDTRLTQDTSYSMYPFIAVMQSYVHVIWMDSRFGFWEIFYKRNSTGNLGVEVSPSHESRVTSYGVFPNPFTSFATLPGHEAERFVLYDISGRWVGVYRGDRVGAGLAPGVYFLRPEGRDAKPLRIIKLR